jgi:hypothetical protein
MGQRWDRLIVVHRSSCNSSIRATNQHRNVDVVNHINRDLTGHRSSNRNINRDLHSVLHHLRDGNGYRHRYLNLHGALNLLSNHNVIWAWHWHRDRARYSNTRVNGYRAGNTNGVHLLDWHNYRLILGDSVR